MESKLLNLNCIGKFWLHFFVSFIKYKTLFCVTGCLIYLNKKNNNEILNYDIKLYSAYKKMEY